MGAPQPHPIQRRRSITLQPSAAVSFTDGCPHGHHASGATYCFRARRLTIWDFVVPSYRRTALVICLPYTLSVRASITTCPLTLPCASLRVQASPHAQAQQRHYLSSKGPSGQRPVPRKRQTRSAVSRATCTRWTWMAAVFAVGKYRQCESWALLVVSDECYHRCGNRALAYHVCARPAMTR